jgi:hypothetical protein
MNSWYDLTIGSIHTMNRRGPRLRLAALAAAMQHSESVAVCQTPPKLQDAGQVKALRLAMHDTSSLTALTTVTGKQHTVTMLKLTTVTPLVFQVQRSL